jgi:hypothetical protein
LVISFLSGDFSATRAEVHKADLPNRLRILVIAFCYVFNSAQNGSGIDTKIVRELLFSGKTAFDWEEPFPGLLNFNPKRTSSEHPRMPHLVRGSK